MFTPRFWKRAFERAVRAFAAALVGALTAGMALTDAAQWKAALITAGTAGLVSVLMSLAGSKVGDSESPSFVSGD